MSSFTWSTEENDWIFLGEQYNEDFNNWKGPMNNGQFLQQNIKETIKTEEKCSKYAGPQCGGLYNEDHGSIIPWSGTTHMLR